MLVCSYNPSSRSALKELKSSFRQRFVTLDLDYLPAKEEVGIGVNLRHELVINDNVAWGLVDGGVIFTLFLIPVALMN